MDFFINYLFEILATILLGVVSSGYRAMLKEFSKQRIEREAIKGLLRSSIISLHSRYTEKGEIPIYAQENVQEMYNCYDALGGNGTINKLFNEIMKLPTQR